MRAPSTGKEAEIIRGQPAFQKAQALTVKRQKPKTKAERKGDQSKKYTAEQLRLNPMLALEGKEESKAAAPKLTAEQKRLNPLADLPGSGASSM